MDNGMLEAILTELRELRSELREMRSDFADQTSAVASHSEALSWIKKLIAVVATTVTTVIAYEIKNIFFK